MYDISIYGGSKKKRKAFKTSTKKRVWMKAGKHNPDNWRTKFIKTSYCMNPRCKRKLTWGDKTYDFDHHNNNNSDNSERNCYVVCKFCHAKHTVLKKKKIKSWGMTVGHKTIKVKTGYKKTAKKKKAKTRKKAIKDDWGYTIGYKTVKVKAKTTKKKTKKKAKRKKKKQSYGGFVTSGNERWF